MSGSGLIPGNAVKASGWKIYWGQALSPGMPFRQGDGKYLLPVSRPDPIGLTPKP